MKGDPAFCLKVGDAVIEFVGDDVDLATKAGFELGFRAKPARLKYKLTFDAAPLESCDYMEWNNLYQAFVGGSSQEIGGLLGKFRFGNELDLRYCGLADSRAVYRFRPGVAGSRMDSSGDIVTVSFGQLPKKMGVSAVTVEAVVSAFEGASVSTRRSGGDAVLVGATEFWPSGDAEIAALAGRITAGCGNDGAKVEAILSWLAPGRNIKFGGPVTGSRYGVKKVLGQKYGQCWDFSDCFITLCRSQGIACRQVSGWLYGVSGHIWAEVLVAGKWRQVDPTGGGLVACGIYHIAYLTSEDGAMPLVYVGRPEIELLGARP